MTLHLSAPSAVCVKEIASAAFLIAASKTLDLRGHSIDQRSTSSVINSIVDAQAR